ncbi:MAG: rod shape-determining protein [Thermoanaerobacteraceae bacterium]|nr:rod shape-determining protein [Thermoanaerobacteraceae bacterium]
MDNRVFALDIGTRTVIGLVMELAEQPRVVAAQVAEHRQRTMLDGQIHDVPRVAELVAKVKQDLEEKVDTKLEQVAVAAAGRALKTARASVTREHNSLEEITEDLTLALEIEAVQEAQRNLVETEQRLSDYHCVGYSVVNYYLANQPITNLVGQFGSSIGVDIIATFLPRVVVDSLINVLHKAGLELASLTLEPIAALNVIVPPNMRQLNLALVDIGAGTSDIAVTNRGTVVGYGMVPFAGDKLTEALCERYLLDFDTGEQVKRQASGTDQPIEFCDVVGMQHQVTREEVIETIKPVVYELAQEIADNILEINGKPPQAVIAIGGGSQTPLLTKAIAEKLSLPENRVAARGREALEVAGEENVLWGPQAVTPIGIAFSWKKNRALEFSNIKVNDRPVRLISADGKGTVADALLAAGINTRQLYGKPGLGLSVTVNGKTRFVKGSLGKPARFTVNGKPAGLDTAVENGDHIQVIPGEKGRDAVITVGELVAKDFAEFRVAVNGEERVIAPKVYLNGQEANPGDQVPDKSVVRVEYPRNVREVLAQLHVQPGDKQVFVNGQRAGWETDISSGDKIELRDLTAAAQHPAGNTPVNNCIKVVVNGETVEVKKANPILTDLFNYVEFEAMPPSASATFLMQVNGEKAQFTTPLKNGDQVTLRWVEN